jgi:hypothetical protein
MNKSKLKGIIIIVSVIITILLGLLALGGFKSIPDVIKSIPKINSDPFQISISPNTINEGQYDNLVFTISIVPNSQLNITSFELRRSNLIIDRLNKNQQTAVTSRFCLNNDYYPKEDCNSEYIFSCNSGGYYGCNNINSKKIKLEGCTNCFYGSSFPYEFTFNILYSVNSGTKQTFTKTVEIPILD